MIGIAPRGGSAVSTSDARASSESSGGAGGMISQLSGSAANRLRAAQIRQASRQPNACSNQADAGQPTVLAKPAIKVIPVIEARASLPYSRVRGRKGRV